MVTVTHSVVKAPGERVFAVADWNANHNIGNIPAGNDEEIQFNDSGDLGASELLTWDGLYLNVHKPVNLDKRARLGVRDVGGTSFVGELILSDDTGTARTYITANGDSSITSNGNTCIFVATTATQADLWADGRHGLSTDLKFQATGVIKLWAGDDKDDYIAISTAADQTTLNFVGQDGLITADGGTIDFNDDHLLTLGNITGTAVTATGTLTGANVVTPGTVQTLQVTADPGIVADLVDFTGVPAAPAASNFLFNTDPVGPAAPGITVGYLCATDPGFGVVYFPYEV